MKKALGDDALNELFREARTHSAWLDKPVSDEILRQLYELMKWGPTSANGSPARLVFLRTPEAKERLRPALAPGNVEKTMTAPVTAIIAYDLLFFEKLQEFFPAGHVKSNFLCNLGYGDELKLFPRGPRLTFNEACTLL